MKNGANLVLIAYEYHNERLKNREVYLYRIFDLGTRRGGWSTPLSGCFTAGKEPEPIA